MTTAQTGISPEAMRAARDVRHRIDSDAGQDDNEFGPLNRLLDYLDSLYSLASPDVQGAVLIFLRDWEGLHCAIDRSGAWRASRAPLDLNPEGDD